MIEDRKTDLDYFIQLQEWKPKDGPEHSAAMWDRRAESWEKEYVESGERTTDDRVQATVNYFKSHNLLGADCDVADIGCGSGRFAAAFAQTARSVTGFDFSERMIYYGAEHARQQGLKNVSFCLCDFQTLDIDAEGFQGRFDLAVSSLTPAVHGMNGLEKMMRMSRAYCCNITHVYSENQLEKRIMRDVFHRDCPDRWNGRYFYSLFNLLYLSGYYPEVSYYRRHKEHGVRSEIEYAKRFMEHLLPPGERTEENAGHIYSWMRANADADGSVMEVSDTVYARTLWDIRIKTKRPDYRLAE